MCDRFGGRTFLFWGMIQTEEKELKYSNYKEQFKRLNKAVNNSYKKIL